MKTPLGILGAGLLAASALVVGCTDSAVDPSTVTAAKAYSAPYVIETELTNFTELPTPQEALSVLDSNDRDNDSLEHHDNDSLEHHDNDSLEHHDNDSLEHHDNDSLEHDRDSLGHQRPGHHGGMMGGDRGRHRGDTVGLGWKQRGMGRDFGRLGMREYGRIFRQLGLTAQQDSLLRGLLQQYRDCAQEAANTYRTARQTALNALKPQIDSIRAEVVAGNMTKEAAYAAISALLVQYRQTIEPLNAQFKADVAACKATFETAFEAILTPEQLQLWLTLKG